MEGHKMTLKILNRNFQNNMGKIGISPTNRILFNIGLVGAQPLPNFFLNGCHNP
jgi:hypothetical protein